MMDKLKECMTQLVQLCDGAIQSSQCGRANSIQNLVDKLSARNFDNFESFLYAINNLSNTSIDIPPLPKIMITTLGKFNIRLTNSKLDSNWRSSKKPIQMLKLLIASDGAYINKSYIFERIWPHAQGNDANNNFSTTLYRLRHLLGSQDAVIMDGGTISLNTEIVWVDLFEYAGYLYKVDSLLQSSRDNFKKISKLTNTTLDMYNDTFLPNDPDLPWVIQVRVRLKSEALGVLLTLAVYWEKQYAYKLNSEYAQKAISCYRKMIDIEPLSESSYYALMRVYIDINYNADAIATFHCCRKASFNTMGDRPGQKIINLYNSISYSV